MVTIIAYDKLFDKEGVPSGYHVRGMVYSKDMGEKDGILRTMAIKPELYDSVIKAIHQKEHSRRPVKFSNLEEDIALAEGIWLAKF